MFGQQGPDIRVPTLRVRWTIGCETSSAQRPVRRRCVRLAAASGTSGNTRRDHCGYRVSSVAGEEHHINAQEGVERARTWLEKTGRVSVQYSVYEVGLVPFLTFQNAVGGSFSFDMGGLLHLDNGKAPFLGEVKKYNAVGDQPAMYKEYLAKCYRTCVVSGNPYHFVWITWHPFSQSNWVNLCTADEVRDAVQTHKATYCGEDTDIDETLCNELAERLWLIVLSDRQEGLSMTDDQLAVLRQAAVHGVAP